MKCSCGFEMKVDAETKEGAVSKLQQMMDQNMMDAHWAEYHKDDKMPKPALDQAHEMITKNLVETQ